MDTKKQNNFAENITENLSETLKETLKETFGQFAGSEDIEAMKESAKEIADTASDFIRKYPVQSIAGAVVVGFIIGNLNSRRKSL